MGLTLPGEYINGVFSERCDSTCSVIALSKCADILKGRFSKVLLQIHKFFRFLVVFSARSLESDFSLLNDLLGHLIASPVFSILGWSQLFAECLGRLMPIDAGTYSASIL